ncbi:putative peptide chain factor 2 [Vibrio phage 249E41-1]|nr:putative peptide chain factor 2 [Vibrio phage 249E41-1]CAH9017536.1 putative peptide chain factor 2 [Vibrio phage 193E37-1]
MKIKPEDVRVSMCNADHQQNLGGWSLETPSGIVLYHKPTGICVECTKHRSQHKNKADALEELLKLIGLAEITKLDQENGLYD